MGSFPKNTQEGKQHRKPGKGKGEDFPISNRKKRANKSGKGGKMENNGEKRENKIAKVKKREKGKTKNFPDGAV